MAISIAEQKEILGKVKNDWWKLDRVVPDDQKRRDFLQSVIEDKTLVSSQVINQIAYNLPPTLEVDQIVRYVNAIPSDQFYNHRNIQGWDHSLESLFRNLKDAGKAVDPQTLEQPIQDLAHLVNADGKNEVPKSAKLKFVAAYLGASWTDDQFFEAQSNIVSEDEFNALVWASVHDENVTSVQWDRISQFVDTAKSRDAIAFIAKDWSSDNRSHAKVLLPKIDASDIPLMAEIVNREGTSWSAKCGLTVAATLVVKDDLPESFDAAWISELSSGSNETLHVSHEALSLLSVERRRKLLEAGLNEAHGVSRALGLVGLAESDELAAAALKKLADASIDKWAKQNWEVFLASAAADCPQAFRDFLGEKHNASKTEMATRALAKAKQPENAELFVKLLGSTSKAVKTAALQGLEDLGDSANDAIAAGVKAKKKAVREACEGLLGSISSKTGAVSDLESAAAKLPAEVNDTISALPVHQTVQFTEISPLFDKHGDAVILPLRDWVAQNPEGWNRIDLWNTVLQNYGTKPGYAEVAVDMVTRLPKIYNYYAERYMTAAQHCKGVDDAVEATLKAGTSANYREYLYQYLSGIRAQKADVSIWLEGLKDSKKTVRDACQKALVDVGDSAVDPLIKMLKGRKKNERLGAANVLAELGDAKALDALTVAVAKEKSDDVIVAMENAITKSGGSVIGGDDGEIEVGDVLEALRKQRKTKPPKYIVLDKLPELKLQDGTKVEGDDLHSLVSRLKKETGEFGDPVLRALAEELTEESRVELSRALYNAWADSGSPSKDKWCVFQLAYFTSPEILDKFAPHVDELATINHHLARWEVRVLANHPSKHGMSWVAHWARAATRDSVRSEAKAQLSAAAKAADLTIDQFSADLNAYISDDVADRNVPTLGLEDGPLVIDFGARVFDVQINQNSEVVCIDRESGKKTKSLPKARKGEDDSQKGEVTTLKKGVRRVTGQVAKRFEEGMISGRTWTGKAFKSLFGKHPILTPMAGRIVFATDDGKTFRISDGEFLDVEYDPVDFADDAVVTVVHRLTLGEDLAQQWGEHFTDSEIVQPFEQIGRPTFSKEAHPFPEKAGPVKRASLAGRLRSQGWRNGYAEDAGMMYDASRLFPGRNLRVEITHGGFYIGDPSWDGADEIEVEYISFADLRGKEIKADKIDDISYSEAFYAIERLVRQ